MGAMRRQMPPFVWCSMIAVGTALQQSTAVNAVANPIRKVVTMLQNMQKQVEEEGEQEKKTL